jgi:hypothetical protein
MSDLDSRLTDVLSANGNYDENQAEEQRRDLRGAFKAGGLRVERIAWAYLLLFTSVGAYCGVRLLLADNARDGVLFGIILGAVLINQSVIKLWYWVMNVKISVLKELKLVRLALASGSTELAAGEESDVESFLRKPLGHGSGSGKLERRLRYLVLIALALGGALLGSNHGRYKAQMAAISAKELTEWHFDSSGTVQAVSRIKIDESSCLSAQLSLTLPYASGVLSSVRLNEQEATFESAGSGTYRVPIPGELMMEDIQLVAVWHFPFTALKQGEHGYRTVLKTLVPVKAYTLNVVIDDASGYELSPWLAKGKATPFSGTSNPPQQSLGSCGLGIIKKR